MGTDPLAVAGKCTICQLLVHRSEVNRVPILGRMLGYGFVPRVLIPILRLACFTGVLLAGVGCVRPAPMTNTVLEQATAPDGRSSAVLVRRFRPVALSHDAFYVVLIPSGKDPQEVINHEDLGDSAVLVATLASRVKLSWQQNSTLRVICDACGLEAIDIMTKRQSSGQTRVVFDGFPPHTAYD